jgi:hypothetical protein
MQFEECYVLSGTLFLPNIKILLAMVRSRCLNITDYFIITDSVII